MPSKPECVRPCTKTKAIQFWPRSERPRCPHETAEMSWHLQSVEIALAQPVIQPAKRICRLGRILRDVRSDPFRRDVRVDGTNIDVPTPSGVTVHAVGCRIAH